MRIWAISWLLLAGIASADTGAIRQKGSFEDKFRQLDTDLPTPGMERAASGAPGQRYWQQRVDYNIRASLDEKKRRITGKAGITYHNNSPHQLEYLWIQLEQNRFNHDSLARKSETAARSGTRRERPGDGDSLSYPALRRYYALSDHEYGFDILKVSNGQRPLEHTIVDTMMRVDLRRPLPPGENTKIEIEWAFNLIHEDAVGGRSGYEKFDDGTELYFAAQWFPRLAAYTDYVGWQNKSFLGRGEFTLEFGNYDVSLDVPADHIVSATGILTNSRQVLSKTQRSRLAKAAKASAPMFVVTPQEALENQEQGTDKRKTWRFKAENVRDFAWASSRKFIWDAQGMQQKDGPDVMVMSFYPPEAEPLWSKYSTHAVIHALEVYSRFSFPYPYPVAQSVNSWARGGMEYPMITFNGYRPEQPDETVDQHTWSRRTKASLIGVIIHEIGHIYFPMIVNSDERQWTWMDEGLNTFLEYVAELEWEENYPAFGKHSNVLDYITRYMTSAKQVPIMTQSDSVLQFGPNAYSKPTAALTILRETVMGREAFDHAFRTYARRWQFKRPTPADFFRTMEDASGIDLDWFWRGWFYSTDHVDIAVNAVREYRVVSGDPEIDFPADRELYLSQTPEPLSQLRNRAEGLKTYVERHPELADLYNEHDRFTVSNADRNKAASAMEELEDWEQQTRQRAVDENTYIYFVDFENIGGLVMPLPLQIAYADGSSEEIMLPAEIWRRDPLAVTRILFSTRQISSIVLDHEHRIADAGKDNNYFPRRIRPARLELNKSERSDRNLMRDMLIELDSKDEQQADPE